MDVRRGDVFYADLTGWCGSEQGGLRPVLVIQNDVGNKYSPTTIAASITSRLNRARLPTHITIGSVVSDLPQTSVILCEQVRTLDKRRLKSYVSTLDEITMKEVDKAIMISLGLDDH